MRISSWVRVRRRSPYKAFLGRPPFFPFSREALALASEVFPLERRPISAIQALVPKMPRIKPPMVRPASNRPHKSPPPLGEIAEKLQQVERNEA